MGSTDGTAISMAERVCGAKVCFHNALQRRFIEDDYVVQAFTAQRADETTIQVSRVRDVLQELRTSISFRGPTLQIQAHA